jgi:hypothetical protein
VRAAVSTLHRWLGAASCLLLLMWFASGAMMVFVEFPQWTRAEDLAHAPPLRAARLLPLAAVAGAEAIDGARLGMFGDRPIWRLAHDGNERSVMADDGSALAPLSAQHAAAEVSHRLGATVSAAGAQRVDEPDQWTVHPSARSQLPAWRFEIEPDATQVYVSMRSGAIAQHTTRTERVLAWLGAIPHWIYPALLVRQRGVWNDVVLALAGLGACACVLGLCAGALAWRVRGAFKNPWSRLHHTLGLLFGVLGCTWTLSGALSLQPLDWSPGPWPTPRERARLAGGTLDPKAFADPSRALAACAARGSAPREIEAVMLGRNAFYVCTWAIDDTRLVRATDGSVLHELPIDVVVRAVQQGWPASRIAASERRTAPDDYHYPRHHDPSFPPYIRIRLADAAATALYIDPFRAALLARHVGVTRLERWLYRGLHSFDWPWLYAHRALWRVLVLALLAAGAALAASGVFMAIRWVARAGAVRAPRV